MRFITFYIVLLGLFSVTSATSQVSHGGTPYFMQPSMMRAAAESFFVEMPSFDLDSILKEDLINEENMQRSYQFAHKFYTHIDINDASQTILPEGITVKQIGIRSAGAYSINLLLRDFEIPPGGKLFVYSANHSHVVGSFDNRNNSPDKILPIQPVAGESIIVEYSEPADAPFKGRFVISEVNHDYRDILRSEPKDDKSPDFACMPDVLCENAAEETVRSAVLLIINGTSLCSGSLINNTSDDGRPLLLTAVHCLNSPVNYPSTMDYYNNRAGTIIAFFNYNRPTCDASIAMRGSEEMSLAGASALAIIERKDLALLEFQDSPPDYFNAYYAGWNRDLTASGNHTNIHHPSAAVAKYGITEQNIRIVSAPPPAGNYLDADSYWQIPYWKVGSTSAGSSGSPLFDENNLIIGGLTSGASECSGTSPSPDSQKQTDYFSVLGKSWETGDPANQLKTYLDPQNKGVVQYPGKDPNQANPVIRMANARYTKGDLLIASALDSPNQGFVFGNSNLQTLEFAEEFKADNPVEIFGTYLLMPAMPFSSTSGVTVSVYTGDSSPQQKIYSTQFVPQYLNYSSGFSQKDKTLTVPTETFVVFDAPVSVTADKFFISYSINYSNTNQFCVYNTKWQDDSHANTAWVKDEVKGWITAESYEVKPLKTSLAIQPLVRNKTIDSIKTNPGPGNSAFYYDRAERILLLKESLKTQGQIAVYSVGGQLLEKLQIQPDQTTIFLREQPKATIGIVKISGNYFSATGKILY